MRMFVEALICKSDTSENYLTGDELNRVPAELSTGNIKISIFQR